MTRTRRDRCPGVLRPWPAEDGLLVRLRLIGGRVSAFSLGALLDVAERYGDGAVHLTVRTNLQLRGLPGSDGALRSDVLTAIEATGLLPTRTHELVRNVMVSPATGLAGGRTDLRPVATELDRRICADDRLAGLPGRFLIVLDDGRGDLVDRSCDLGLVALDDALAQVRVGDGWGAVVPLDDAATAIVGLAHEFLGRRGDGPGAAWHVTELSDPLGPLRSPERGVPSPCGPLPFDEVGGGRHIAVPDGRLDRALLGALREALTGEADELVVTPWHGVLVPRAAR